MSKISLLLAVLLGCSALVVTACGSASGSIHRSERHTKLMREPWDQITRGKNSTTLLMNTTQSGRNRSDPCFIHYTTRVVKQTSHHISIELLAPNTDGRSFQCTAKGVGGPFLVPVHLKKRYRGQRLLDPVTGHFHRLTSRSELH